MTRTAWSALLLLSYASVVFSADTRYGRVYGTADCSDTKSQVRTYLKMLDLCTPGQRCDAAVAIRKVVFGDQFNNSSLPDFIVYFGSDGTYGPVLSSHGKYEPHLFGARQIYVLAFSDNPTERQAVLTTLRPKTTTPIEVALQALGKIGAFSAGAAEKSDAATPVTKALDMHLLSQSCEGAPLYFGMTRFPVDTDTSSHIGVNVSNAVVDWKLQREVKSNTVTATLTRKTTMGETTVTETIPVPESGITEDVIGRYAKTFDETVGGRAAAKDNPSPASDPDAAATLNIAKFPVIEKAADKGTGGTNEATAPPDGECCLPAVTRQRPPRATIASDRTSCDKLPCTIALSAAVVDGAPPYKYEWSQCAKARDRHVQATCEIPAGGKDQEHDATLQVTDADGRVAWAHAHFTVEGPATPATPAPLTYTRTVTDKPGPLLRAGGFFSNSEGRRVSVSVGLGFIRARTNIDGVPGPSHTTTDTKGNSTTTTDNSSTGTEPTKNGQVVSSVTTNGTQTVTTTTQTDLPALQTRLNFYVMTKLYLIRPRLGARDGDAGAPYRPSVALALGTTLSLNELVAGITLGHLLDRVGVTFGRDWVSKDKTFAESKARWFVALDYSL
jgi:hypothetical protein